VYDRNLLCRALNDALAAMDIVSVGEHAGQSVHEVFGCAAEELDQIFRRVLDTGHNVSDFLLTVSSAGKSGARRWSVNFYPVKDKSGRVWLVAATFWEVTKRNSAALHLGRAIGSPGRNCDGEPSLLGGELCELLARSLQLARRSVELMDDTISLRFYVSETRMETGLEPLHLFLTATRSQESLLHSFLPHADPAAGISESPVQSASAAPVEGALSPRECQVLNLLAAGKSNKEIGSALKIGTRTVETYRARLMNKLELHTTAELVRYAIRNKMIDA
jgi:DNA-binding CsgD family transcriptional regulator